MTLKWFWFWVFDTKWKTYLRKENLSKEIQPTSINRNVLYLILYVCMFKQFYIYSTINNVFFIIVNAWISWWIKLPIFYILTQFYTFVRCGYKGRWKELTEKIFIRLTLKNRKILHQENFNTTFSLTCEISFIIITRNNFWNYRYTKYHID